MMKEETRHMHSRREFIRSTTLMFTGLLIGLPALSKIAFAIDATDRGLSQANRIGPICVFSKHLEWLPIPEMAKAVITTYTKNA